MTNQETFDRVIDHLRKQGCKAEDENGCVYLDPETGRKCAAGCLISKDRYTDKIEGASIFDDYGRFSTSSPEYLVSTIIKDEGHDLALVKELQAIHDSYDVEDWEAKFRVVARTFSLEYNDPSRHDEETWSLFVSGD